MCQHNEGSVLTSDEEGKISINYVSNFELNLKNLLGSAEPSYVVAPSPVYVPFSESSGIHIPKKCEFKQEILRREGNDQFMDARSPLPVVLTQGGGRIIITTNKFSICF